MKCEMLVFHNNVILRHLHSQTFLFNVQC